MVATVDELFDRLSQDERPGIRIAQLNLYDNLARHIIEVRGRIDSGDRNPALSESLDRNVPLYRRITGIDPLPNDDRAELIGRLTNEFKRRNDEWKETPEYAKRQKKWEDFMD